MPDTSRIKRYIARACHPGPMSAGSEMGVAQAVLAQVFGFFALALFLVVAFFVVSILIAIWVYRDAEERGMDGVLWLIVVLIANVVGLIIYLVVRSDRSADPGANGPFCPSCGASVGRGARYCPNCGHALARPE